MRTFCLVVAALFIAMVLVGCETVSKPYVMKVDREDQKLDMGNRGYLKGVPPPARERGELKRPLIAVDIDLVQVQGKKTQSTEMVQGSGAKQSVSEAPQPVQHKTALKEEEIK